MLSKKGLSIHKNLLRKLVNDESLSSNNRFRAEMLLLCLEGFIPSLFLESIFVKKLPPGVILQDDGTYADSLSKEAKLEIAKMMESVNIS